MINKCVTQRRKKEKKKKSNVSALQFFTASKASLRKSALKHECEHIKIFFKIKKHL